MKRIALVAFDQYTDIDLFLAWDLFSRIGADRCSVQIVANTARITSTTGIRIARHAPWTAAVDADAVYFCSGEGTRVVVDDRNFKGAMHLDEQRQVLAAVDSGALLLARLGHLRGRRATTFPSAELHDRLTAYGATPIQAPLVVEGNVATAAQCLAGVDLVRWVTTRLFGPNIAASALATALPLHEIVPADY